MLDRSDIRADESGRPGFWLYLTPSELRTLEDALVREYNREARNWSRRSEKSRHRMGAMSAHAIEQAGKKNVLAMVRHAIAEHTSAMLRQLGENGAQS